VKIIFLGKAKRFFYYTTKTRLEEIIKIEIISIATAGIDNKKEKPSEWVSTNPKWEAAATKMISNQQGQITQMTFEEKLVSVGCARMEEEDKGLFPWKTIWKISI
jgi:hypothetical protein